MNLLHWNIWLSYISDLADWFPLIVYMTLDQQKRRSYHLLGAYLFINSILKTSTFIILNVVLVNTLPVYHVLALSEFFFLFLFFSQALGWQKWKWLVVFVIISLNIGNTIFLQPVHEFNSYSWAANSLVLVAMGLLVLYRIYVDMEDVSLHHYPLFIITSAVLIYLAGSLFTYILGSDILSKEAKSVFHNAWIIRSISDIVKSILLLAGLWVLKRN